MYRLLLAIIAALIVTPHTHGNDWTFHSPRPEIAPESKYEAKAGPEGGELLTIEADERPGLFGYWKRTFAVEGGQHYRFRTLRKLESVSVARRTAVARLLWKNAAGKPVLRDRETYASYRPGTRPRAEPEFPGVTGTFNDEWMEVSGVYEAPSDATQAIVELYYRWEPGGTVRWADTSLVATSAPEARIVRLATIHHRPREGSSIQDKCRQFAPLIAEAARKKADLVVLPETLTYYGSGRSYDECAEPIPGHATDYFGRLAKQHDLYIAAGLLEREKHLVYNVCVLIGPDGEIVGKYRKVTLPRGEIEGGITPGTEYPVFQTRFGKVGLMICYDGFFPEVARELTKGGAEVIAWPVWGCNPMLGAARACENHVYVVSSTYTDAAQDWMVSAVYGHDGKLLAQAKEWGGVAIAEVDLNRPLFWHSLGDFRAQIEPHRPPIPSEE